MGGVQNEIVYMCLPATSWDKSVGTANSIKEKVYKQNGWKFIEKHEMKRYWTSQLFCEPARGIK